jgi:hypothetical protein
MLKVALQVPRGLDVFPFSASPIEFLKRTPIHLCGVSPGEVLEILPDAG